MSTICWCNAEAVPGCGAVASDTAVGDFAFQQFERAANSRVEFGAADYAKLALRIMQIVDIDGLESEVGAAQIDHRFEPSRRHAMRPFDQIFGSYDTRLDVSSFEIFSRIGRHLAVESDVAALGGYDDLLAPNLTRGGQFRDDLADDALAPLEAIIDCSIHQVDAAQQRGSQGIFVRII